jgi:hypothetical protein
VLHAGVLTLGSYTAGQAQKALRAHQREVVCLNRFEIFYCVEHFKICFETTSCLRVPSLLDSFSILRDFISFGNYL